MTENLEGRPQENQSENAPPQQQPQNDAYFSYTRQLQNESSTNVEIEEKRGEIENKFNEFLRALNEESSLLNEFLAEEKKLTDELCELLTQILRRLKISFNIPPQYVANVGEARQIKLNSEGHLIIIRDEDKVDSKLLQNYPPEIVLTVLWVIVPEFERVIKVYRKKISRRVSLLEKVKQELKNIQKAFSPEEKESFEQLQHEETRPVIAGET